MTIIVTGAAGFIGSHFSKLLINQGLNVIGVDNLNDYYSPELKKLRLLDLEKDKNFRFLNADISDKDSISALIGKHKPQTIVHLAAQAGVRLPLTEYERYVQSNLIGFSNVALTAAENNVANLLYASSSSVYGNSTNLPYKESDKNLKQISFYGATKYSNEILSYSLSQTTSMRVGYLLCNPLLMCPLPLYSYRLLTMLYCSNYLLLHEILYQWYHQRSLRTRYIHCQYTSLQMVRGINGCTLLLN